MSQRRIALVTIGVLAVMVSAVSLAWACFPGTSMTLSRDSGSPGTTVTATLGGFPADQPVEVRLDSFTGPVLAQSARRSSGNPFPLTFTIPANTSAGCHLVVGFVVDEEHRGHSQTAAPFKVVTEANPDPNCTTPPLWRAIRCRATRRRRLRHRVLRRPPAVRSARRSARSCRSRAARRSTARAAPRRSGARRSPT